MMNDSTSLGRRVLLQAMASVAAASQLGTAAACVPNAPAVNGKPGDFDFLTDRWKIANRRLVDGKWDAFEGESTVYGLLGGVASVEELRIPARQFSGMAVRLLDLERKLWADHWIGGRAGIMDRAPGWGSFVDGVGRWDTQDGGVITRGVWDQITPSSCRWFQMRSSDQGQSWTENWIMHWTRA